MKRCMFVWFVIFFLFMFSNLISEVEDYSKPVITGAEPSRVDILGGAGEINIVLKGHNFTIYKNDCRWNARRTMLFVRHTARGNQWQGIANNYRIHHYDDWPNPPSKYGLYGCFSEDRLSVTLPRSIWCTSEGQLEFMLTKGTTDPNSEWLFAEQTRSNVFSIPVVSNPNDTPVISEIRPGHYYVGQDASSISVYGTFRNESTVEINGKPLKTRRVEQSSHLIVAELPFGFLDREAMHMVRLIDPEGTPSTAKSIWVYGPVRVLKCTPPRLNRGLGQADIKIKYGGLRPFRVQAKMVPDPESTSANNGPHAPIYYVEVPYSIPKMGKLNVILSKKWMSREGKIHLKLESSAGNAVQQIPVVPSLIGKLSIPGKMSKTPLLTLRLPAQQKIFNIPPLYKTEIKKLAAISLKGNRDGMVLSRMKQILIRYRKQKKGAGAPSAYDLIDALKQEAIKEMVNKERNKEQEILESQRARIKKLISKIKQMWKVQKRTFQQTRIH